MYILSRWRKDVKRSYSKVKVSYGVQHLSIQQERYAKMWTAFSEVKNITADVESSYKFVLDWINMALKDLSKQIQCASVKTIVSPTTVTGEVSHSSNNVEHVINDLVATRRKGHPSFLRKQSVIRKKLTKKKKIAEKTRILQEDAPSFYEVPNEISTQHSNVPMSISKIKPYGYEAEIRITRSRTRSMTLASHYRQEQNPCGTGDNSWSEGVVALFPLLSISDGGIANEDLDFLVVPQYGRNADRTVALVVIKAPTRQVQIKLESQPGGSLVTDRDLTRLVAYEYEAEIRITRSRTRSLRLAGHYREEKIPGGTGFEIQQFAPIVTIYVYFPNSKNSQKQLDYFLSFDYRSRDLFDLKNMETTCAGDNSWSEGVVALFPLLSISDGGIANEDLDFLVVPQYGRNADRTG
ncbi:hypothetical protein WN943_006792 [Citrus x changshan-huyou]